MEHFDVVVVGAGISGIGAGYHLQDKCPDRRYVILEGRDKIGGTWDLFKYPGIRSDSDMYTLGYSFRPWTDPKAIADGPDILKYLNETASEYGIDRHIRYQHFVKSAAWCSKTGCWTVDVEDRASGEMRQFSCNFLFMCSGYYDYDKGYTPDFKGIEKFSGQVIHPQQWAEGTDYANKRVVVIGSGATAVTLVPELAKQRAKHVTMLQRSPTYIVSSPGTDQIAVRLNRWLPPRLAAGVIRWRNVLFGLYFFRMCKKQPDRVRKMMLDGVRGELGPDYDIDTHFTPRYNPWDQRLCLVPDGDMFKSIKAGDADVVTDHIQEFTENGILLESGELLEADLVVTATGLNMQLMSNLEIIVDGEKREVNKSFTYKGMMFSEIPNLALSMGYTNASWTLKCDLTCKYICRLLNHMTRRGYHQCMPSMNDDSVQPEPFIDFSSGYVLRAQDKFPKQGNKTPWKLHQNYLLDLAGLSYSALEDGTMTFSSVSEYLPVGEKRELGEKMAAKS